MEAMAVTLTSWIATNHAQHSAPLPLLIRNTLQERGRHGDGSSRTGHDGELDRTAACGTTVFDNGDR